MADHSKISWTEATWNPVSGCRKVSAGCDNCYAIKDAHRLAGNANPKVAAPYTAVTAMINGRLNWTGIFHELPERLDQPLRWTKPRRIFVNSMSDLFGEGISNAHIARVFGAIAAAPHHQFQVLTKRPERMQELLGGGKSGVFWGQVSQAAWELLRTRGGPADARQFPPLPQPLPNVWLGTSVEDQKAANQRIPALLATPAAIRFLSCEPLLGPIDLHSFLADFDLGRGWRGNLHWVIAGGESGPGARPCRIEWIQDLARQCREAAIPLFVKQLGAVPALLSTDRLAGWPAHVEYRKDLSATDVLALRHPKGGDPEEWPEDLRIREHPR